MLSVSRSRSKDPKHHRNFTVVKPRSLDEWLKITTHQIWSPILWHGGVRRGDNYMSCTYLGLDFDSGEWTIDDAIQYVTARDYSAIIGTTKSHQKPKTSASGRELPACDRFRLIMPFESAITEKSKYLANVARCMESMPVDEACKDAARYFWPCRQVAYHHQGANKFPVHDIHLDDTPKQFIRTLKEEKELSNFAANALAYGIPSGNGVRHTSLFKLGSHMSYAGYSEDEIFSAISQAPIEFDKDDYTRAVRNGIRAAHKNMETV